MEVSSVAVAQAVTLLLVGFYLLLVANCSLEWKWEDREMKISVYGV